MIKTGPQTDLADILAMGSTERARFQDRVAPRLAHGGALSRGKRKTERPFNEKAPIRIVLASRRAKGLWSLQHRRNHSKISRMIYVYGERYQVKVYRSRIEGGEIHLLLKTSKRKGLADFLRVLAGRVAVIVSGARKGVRKVGKFWNELCWSKLLNWGSEFFQARAWFVRSDQALSPILDPVLETPVSGFS
jgi:hypothetical protein